MVVMLTGCPDTDNPVNQSGLKGYIYYSNGGSVYRIRLNDEKDEELFSNADMPDVAADGRIVAVEAYPNTRIIVTDLTGANRVSIIESEGYKGPVHKKYFDKPRISYNQQYIAYEGDAVLNPITYIIDANDGELLLTIGDYDDSFPCVAPSWAPDGSIYVAGWTSMNNGIYRVSADFTTMERIDPDLNNVYSPSVSPDGTKVAFICNGKLWTMNSDGSNATQINTTINNFAMPTWSPDSKNVAVTSYGTIYIIDLVALTVTEIDNAYASSGNQLCWRY
ncbi:MAG: hypothetical protein CVV22_11210 [Ignavibacteriae bacterium HGW-Ignavibacteriae-1]|nr:MAG: hypothetical protein CVV22_11210 [Ignavibacteriae bacterium HGW-Ignavibacteriae-1]